MIGIKTIKLKRRYGRFFKRKEEQETVFALYEDVNGYVHYKYCNYDTDTYQMPVGDFFNTYTEFI